MVWIFYALEYAVSDPLATFFFWQKNMLFLSFHENFSFNDTSGGGGIMEAMFHWPFTVIPAIFNWGCF